MYLVFLCRLLLCVLSLVFSVFVSFAYVSRLPVFDAAIVELHCAPVRFVHLQHSAGAACSVVRDSLSGKHRAIQMVAVAGMALEFLEP